MSYSLLLLEYSGWYNLEVIDELIAALEEENNQ